MGLRDIVQQIKLYFSEWITFGDTETRNISKQKVECLFFFFLTDSSFVHAASLRTAGAESQLKFVSAQVNCGSEWTPTVLFNTWIETWRPLWSRFLSPPTGWRTETRRAGTSSSSPTGRWGGQSEWMSGWRSEWNSFRSLFLQIKVFIRPIQKCFYHVCVSVPVSVIKISPERLNKLKWNCQKAIRWCTSTTD